MSLLPCHKLFYFEFLLDVTSNFQLIEIKLSKQKSKLKLLSQVDRHEKKFLQYICSNNLIGRPIINQLKIASQIIGLHRHLLHVAGYMLPVFSYSAYSSILLLETRVKTQAIKVVYYF